MGKTLTHKILAEHLVTGEMAPGQSIGIRIDQTLTQDATGTTAFLLLEAMGVARVRTELSVSYVDHNMAQFGPENHNDHLYLQSIARKVGAFHSRPGNGICHQVHLERFARAARGGRCSAPTATPPPPAAWAASPSARAGWTWPSRWAAGRSTSPCRV